MASRTLLLRSAADLGMHRGVECAAMRIRSLLSCIASVLAACAAVLLLACGGNEPTVVSEPVRPVGPPAALEIVSGDHQTVAVGDSMQPVVLVVRDAQGRPVPRVEVNAVVDNPAIALLVVVRSAVTDSSGRATLRFNLGTRADTYRIPVQVRSPLLQDTVTGTLVAGPPAAIRTLSFPNTCCEAYAGYVLTACRPMRWSTGSRIV